MSWDRSEYTEFSPCACGRGKVTRVSYREEDDWNRTRYRTIGEKIECDYCKNEYRIEKHIRETNFKPWEGDSSIEESYLVPKKLSIPETVKEKSFCFKFDEQIVAYFTKEEIVTVIEDMISNKYSTRLKQENSKKIVTIYRKTYNKVRLSPIIELLNTILENYNSYEWTHDKYMNYKAKEKNIIEENNRIIKECLDQSVLLNFGRADYEN